MGIITLLMSIVSTNIDSRTYATVSLRSPYLKLNIPYSIELFLSHRNRSRRSSAAAAPSKSTESTTSTPKSKSPNVPAARTPRTNPGQTSAKASGEASSKQVVSPTVSAKNPKVPIRPGIPWIAGTRLEAKDYLDKWWVTCQCVGVS